MALALMITVGFPSAPVTVVFPPGRVLSGSGRELSVAVGSGPSPSEMVLALIITVGFPSAPVTVTLPPGRASPVVEASGAEMEGSSVVRVYEESAVTWVGPSAPIVQYTSVSVTTVGAGFSVPG
jgi:hypothetical protein